jgi:hypothetical protein
LKKLNQFGRKLTDFKNTLYTPCIHLDNPLLDIGKIDKNKLRNKNKNRNKSFEDRSKSPYRRESSIEYRSQSPDDRRERFEERRLSQISSQNYNNNESNRKRNSNYLENIENLPLSPIKFKHIPESTKITNFFDSEKINKINNNNYFINNHNNNHNKSQIDNTTNISESKKLINSSNFSKMLKTNKELAKEKFPDIDNENININFNMINDKDKDKDKRIHRGKQLSLLNMNLKGLDFSKVISKNNFNAKNSTTGNSSFISNNNNKNENDNTINNHNNNNKNESDSKKTSEFFNSLKFNKLDITKNEKKNNMDIKYLINNDNNNNNSSFKRKRNQSLNYLPINEVSELTKNNLYMNRAKIMIDNKMTKLIEHFDQGLLKGNK